MNNLPAELRTPPLPLIAFIGCPELHKDVGMYFNQTLRPPFFSVGLAEPNEQLLIRLFGTKKQPKPFRTPDGILKADWFQKQRQRRAAVAVAFVPRTDVEGDPSSWMRMLSGLRTVRSTSSHKGIQLVVVVVQDSAPTELPADRVMGLCNNLSLEQRQLCLISRRVVDASLPPEERRQYQDAELAPLGQLVTEAAAAYYAAAAERLRQKQVDLAAALGTSPPEVNAAIAFKLAVLAEFRQDWLAAVSSYQAAAAALQGVPLGRPSVSCQRHAEVTAVAEIANFKAMMLLLHQQRYAEAVQQLRGHLSAFGPAPDGLPLAAIAAHHGWLARQYQTSAEMVAMSRMDQTTLQAHKDVSPDYLQMSAAQTAVTRKALAEQLHQLRGEGQLQFDISNIRKGRYLGQVELKKLDGLATGSDMTDAEFAVYLEGEERRVNHSQQVMELLLQAQTMHLKQAGPAAAPAVAGAVVARSVKASGDRLQARLAWLLAEQHMDSHNLTAARKLLLQTVYTYRRDGWDVLLLQPLLLLRDICQRLKLHQEGLLHTLELACVADSLAASTNSSDHTATTVHELADHQQAVGLAAAALASMLVGAGDKKGSIMKTSSNMSPRITAAADEPLQQRATSPVSSAWTYTVQQLDLSAALQQLPAMDDDIAGARPTHVADILQQYHQQEFGWWRILTVSGGFVAHAPDPAQLQVCIALCNHLPVPIPLTAAAVILVDSKGSWAQELVLGAGPLQQAVAAHEQQHTAAAGHSSTAARQSAADSAAAGLHVLHIATPARAAAAWPAQLQPGSWLVAHAVVTPRTVGNVRVDQLHLQLSDFCNVKFLPTSFPPGHPALGQASLPHGQEPFKVQQGVRQGMWVTKVQHVGRLPDVQVVLPQLMLVSEFCPVHVRLRTFAAQSAANLELSLRSPTGAVPGQVTMLAAMPDGKLQALSTERHTIQLPDLVAGSSFSQRLWVRSTLASSCRLTAVLSCPTQVHQSAELHFVEAFEVVTRLAGELGVHTLVAPAQSYAAVSGPSASEVAGAVPLAVGQVVFAQVLVRAVHDVELQVLDAQLELQQDAGLQVMNNLSDQLVDTPLQMSCGSVHCLLLQLVPLSAIGTPASIGRLQLRWERRQPLSLNLASNNGVADGAEGWLQQRSSAPHAPASGLAVGAAPPNEVVTSLDLPQVVVQDSLLTIKVVAPHSATAGIAFPSTLQMSNMTSQPQEVSIAVQEANGFVFSGEKQQSITVAPRDSSSLTWTLVAHASGQLPVPSVRISSGRFNCHVLTQQAHVHVMPF